MPFTRIALSVLATLPLFAQEHGSLSGTVLGVTGEPAPSLAVAVRNSSSNLQRTTVTDLNGRFLISELHVGSYQVVTTSVIYGTRTARVLIHANQETALTFLPTEVTQFSASTNRLPSNGRSAIDVLREQASVTGDSGASLNSAGLRPENNHFVLDGLDIDQPWTRAPILVPPAETIDAVNLLQGFVPAEFGKGAGAAIILQSKTGSSGFHGSAFENFRNSVLSSPNYFDGDRKSPSAANRFGANLSGPVQRGPIQERDWFFFAAGEGNRAKQGLTVISTVPSATQKAGNFSPTNIYDPLTISSIGENIFARQPFSSNRIPLARISSAVQRLVAVYPTPNLPGAANNFRYQPSSILNRGHFDLRSDKRITPKNTMFVRLAYHAADVQSPGSLGNAIGNDVPQGATNSTTSTKAWAGVVGDTHELKPYLLNQLRVGGAIYNLNAQPLNPTPTIDITGYASLGSAGAAPSQVRTSNYQIEDHLTWTSGRNIWSFGAQAINRRANGTASDVTSRGNYIFTPDYTSYPGTSTGDAFASLLLGFPEELKRDVQFSAYQLREWEWSGFAQDQFRWKRLTVQAGVRYSFLPPVTEANIHIVNFNFSNTSPALNQFAGQAGVNNFGGLDLNRRAFAPRIGLVFQFDDATVLRGGFSKNFDTGTFFAMGRLARNAPYASQLDIVNGTFQLGANLSAGLPALVSTALLSTAALNASSQAVNAIEPQKVTPYADQWDLFLQRRLSRKLMLEIGGLGSMGIHLYAAWDANQPYPAPTPYATPRYPFEPFHGRVNYLNLGGGSTYYGGQAKLSGELVNGLAIQFSYAFAKSLDDATQPGTTSASRPAGPQFIYNARGNRSPSTYDVTHRAVLSANYRLPQLEAFRRITANWNASTLVTLQSGLPFTPQLATNSLNDGGFQLPNRVGQGTISNPTPAKWFDTSLTGAFRVPALYQYGNSGFGILRGPGLATVDTSLVRGFRLSEKLRLDARAEAFNLFNHPNFALPDRILGTASSGTINHTATPPRQLQLSILVNF